MQGVSFRLYIKCLYDTCFRLTVLSLSRTRRLIQLSGYILVLEHSIIAPFYHNMCLVFTLQNREIHAQKTEPENGRDERSKSFPFFIGLNFHVNNFKAKEIFDDRS